MNRINLFRNTPFRSTPATLDSVAWDQTNFEKTTGALVFAALLIVCSIAVGCSSDQPKPVSSTNQPAMTQSTQPTATSSAPSPATPALQAAAPVHKKVVRKVPATVKYADKTSGVSFQYPRRYALKTGEAADQLVSSDPFLMDFVQPGGVALAAVAVPGSAYPNSDLAAAFFNVSLNKTLTAEQCGEFSVPPANPAVPVDPAVASAQPSKLMIGDMELQSSETLASQGTREEASKYYHVFQNGACYEFALKVATTGVETEAGAKHVDRKEVFQRLEKILATVKIHLASETTASAPAPAAPGTPAQ
jgi:hypothetical protein